MKNITVTVTDEEYRHARVWAAQNDTSVSAFVRRVLKELAGPVDYNFLIDEPDPPPSPRFPVRL